MTTFIRSGFAAIFLLVAFAANALAAGVDVNATTTGLALRGYDPVSYFKAGEPQAGDINLTAEYKGATYRFATKENQEAFQTNPARYAPQYGGFCAFGTAMGYKFDGDPHVWKIVDDKLYLNLSKAVSARWNEDVPGYIKTANEKWDTIADKDPSDLQ